MNSVALEETVWELVKLLPHCLADADLLHKFASLRDLPPHSPSSAVIGKRDTVRD